MSHTWLYIILATFCFCAPCWQGISSAPGGWWATAKDSGKVEVSPSLVDYRLDDHQNGAKVVYLTVRNRTSRDVELLSMNATCPCAEPQMKPQVLCAGREVQVLVKVDPPAYGDQKTYVTLRTGSPNTPVIKIPLHLHGKKVVAPFVSFAPADVRIDALAGVSPVTKVIRVTCAESPGELWLTELKSTSDQIMVKPPRLVKETKLDSTTLVRDYDIELDVANSSTDSADVSCLLLPITRTEPTRPNSRMGVRVSRVAALRAAPSSIVASFPDSRAKEITRRVVLQAADDAEWSITSIEADVPWIKAGLAKEDSSNGNRAVIIAASQPETWESKSHEGQLHIRTNHPHCPEITVRVTALRNTR